MEARVQTRQQDNLAVDITFLHVFKIIMLLSNVLAVIAGTCLFENQ